jgi:small subunit ribosomal protein S3
MIERKIVNDRMKEFMIEQFVSSSLQKVGYSKTKVQKTPVGEKIIIYASRPGLIVGRKGGNIKSLTRSLKHKFKLENPQIEINEIPNPNLDAQIVAEKVQSTLERFGSKRFKGVGHKAMEDVMKSKAMGCEILISGKIPSSRAKRWRFYQGYLKKSGDIAVSQVKTAYTSAHLKSGIVGIQVRIMLPDTELPDVVDMKKIEVIESMDIDESEIAETVEEKPKKKAPKKAKENDKAGSKESVKSTSDKKAKSAKPKDEKSDEKVESVEKSKTEVKAEEKSEDKE